MLSQMGKDNRLEQWSPAIPVGTPAHFTDRHFISGNIVTVIKVWTKLKFFLATVARLHQLYVIHDTKTLSFCCVGTRRMLRPPMLKQ
jgi:hypothetical protein